MDNKAVLWLYSQLPDLIGKNIITEETAEKLKNHFGVPDPDSKKQIILTLFGILGAIFVGLGIILMIGYNWDNLSRPVKTVLSFLPLLIGQVICIFVIIKKYRSVGWREGSAIFLMATIGASISLISQTYHNGGDFGDFLLAWMLLSMPLIYIMRSSSVAFFYLVGLTFWAGITPQPTSFLFWPFVAFIIPEVISSLKENPYSNRTLFLSWAIPICLGFNIFETLGHSDSGLWKIIYSSYFSLLFLSGQLWFKSPSSFFLKPFQVMGVAGIITLGYIFTYSEPWNNQRVYNPSVDPSFNIPVIIMAICLPIIVLYLMSIFINKGSKYEVLLSIITILAIINFLITYFYPDGNFVVLNQLIFNIYMLTIGIVTIIAGTKNNRMATVNGGMLIIALLIMLRFFDIDLSFLLRGLIFIFIGIAFFVSNYIMVRKTKVAINEE